MRLAIILLGLAVNAASAFGQSALNVYNWTDYTVDGQLDDFEKQTGVRVNYTTYNTNEILDAKLRSGQWSYDVVVPTASPFFVNQVRANLFHRLDRSRLANWNRLDPEITAALARVDPGNAHGIPLTWGTIGIGYDTAEIGKRMAGAPVDSLRMIFDPTVVAKFADCGVVMLDSPTEIFPAALKYLGLDPDSTRRQDLARAAEAVNAVRRYIRKFDSLDYIYSLGDGESCLAFGFAGGIFQAQQRAARAGKGRRIAYATPKEGSLLWIDVAAIPRNAPNLADAYRFLDFLMEPKVAAAASEATGYAFANKAAMALLPRQTLDNPLIFPPRAARERFYTITARDAERMREIERRWAVIKRAR